jgi:hypothetical protein
MEAELLSHGFDACRLQPIPDLAKSCHTSSGSLTDRTRRIFTFATDTIDGIAFRLITGSRYHFGF